MLFPVGPQPPSVYWRRRLLLVAGVAAVAILLVLTTKAVVSGASGSTGGSGPQAGGPLRAASTTSTTGADRTTHAASPTPTASATTTATAPAGTSPSAGATSTPAPASSAAAACVPSQLQLAAVVAQPTYQVGADPVLGLKITNPGQRPCVQDVADAQIVLTVYNGASRVWGSHDCQVEPGVMKRTFNPAQPAIFTITWSGLSSQQNCAGTRQRVGAGTYTLYATLSGQQATAAQFAIS